MCTMLTVSINVGAALASLMCHLEHFLHSQ